MEFTKKSGIKKLRERKSKYINASNNSYKTNEKRERKERGKRGVGHMWLKG